MSNFYVGQKVVYITGISMPKGSIHIVKRILPFPCGCIALDIGKTSHYGSLSCDKHKCFNGEISFCDHFDSSSFRPLLTDSIEFAETLLNEITIEINEENLITK